MRSCVILGQLPALSVSEDCLLCPLLLQLDWRRSLLLPDLHIGLLPVRARWRFPLPAYIEGIADVFRLDADGVYDVEWSRQNNAVEISDTASRAVLYIATPDPNLRSAIEAKRQELIEAETALDFDPARDDDDFEQLVQLADSK